MAFTRVHHVGMVVAELEQGRHVLCDGFGLAIDEHRTPWPQGKPGYDNTTVVDVPIGEMYYEVAKPNDTQSGAAQFLAASGGRGGMHYISIASDDMASDVRGLMSRGIKLQGRWDGKSPVFLDPATCLGLGLQITPDDHYYVHPHYRGNGVLTGMGHIGVAARSPEETQRFWGQALGLRADRSSERGLQPQQAPSGERRAADDPVHILEYPLGGTVIEISHPTTTDSGTARLVAQRAPLGAVYHHTCPYAPDIHRFVEQAVAAGLQQIGAIPPREQGVSRGVAWFHPRTCLGMLVEIWNRPPGGEHLR